MLEARRWRQFDMVMVVTAVFIVLYGIAMIHSATCGSGCVTWSPGDEGKRHPTGIQFFPPSDFALRQAAFAPLGLALMLAVAAVDFRVIRALAYPTYGVSILFLGAVLVFGRGEVEYGARRWIDLGLFEFQPSEVARVALVLALARWLSSHEAQRLSSRRLVGSLLFAAVPALMVFKQPDLGTAVGFMVIWFGMLIAAGARPRQLGAVLASTLAAAPIFWILLLDYQRQRLATFFRVLADPESDIFGEGYNILQARISIGSGGMGGRGFGLGEQTQFDYLLVKHNDFIFSVLAEEMGFRGAIILLALLILLLLRIIRAADRAGEPYGRLLTYGIACMLLFQTVVNLGANLTLLPVTGIPLPLVSYGRSALLANFAALGLVQGVLMRRPKYRY